MLLQVSFEVEMNEAILWNELGNIYLKIGSPEEAIAAYTKAIELNPDSGWPYCNLGHAYFQMGDFGQALFHFRKSIQLMDAPEKQAVVWNKIGDTYRALKDIENAIQAYKKADALDMGTSPSEPNASRHYRNLSTFREIIKSEKIVSETNHSLVDLPKTATHSESSLNSQDLSDGSQPAKVGKGFGESYLQPDRPETKVPFSPKPNWMTDQNITTSTVGNNQNAVRLAGKAEKSPLPKEKPFIVFPNSQEMAENHSNEGTTQEEAEQMRKSITASRQNEIRDEKSKDTSNKKTGIDNLEEILAKVNIYENITRVNQTSDRAWDTLGKLYKSLGRYKDAIGAYQKAIEIAPEREVYYYYLGLLYSVEQQHDEAVRAFQFVLYKNPDYVLAHSALAGVYHRMGLENKANHHIATALPKMNNESAYNRACFYAICGDTELAFEFLRLALMNKDTTIEWIKSDPDLDPIRTDQRYQELISDKDQPAPGSNKENYFSSELEGTKNQLLPVLNHSLTR
jgi:tetratricopeptide (TPR) repeat protein